VHDDADVADPRRSLVHPPPVVLLRRAEQQPHADHAVLPRPPLVAAPHGSHLPLTRRPSPGSGTPPGPRRPPSGGPAPHPAPHAAAPHPSMPPPPPSALPRGLGAVHHPGGRGYSGAHLRPVPEPRRLGPVFTRPRSRPARSPAPRRPLRPRRWPPPGRPPAGGR